MRDKEVLQIDEEIPIEKFIHALKKGLFIIQLFVYHSIVYIYQKYKNIKIKNRLCSYYDRGSTK